MFLMDEWQRNWLTKLKNRSTSFERILWENQEHIANEQLKDSEHEKKEAWVWLVELMRRLAEGHPRSKLKCE